MRRLVVSALVVCAMLVGGWSGSAQAQTGGDCPAGPESSDAAGDVALFLESTQTVIEGLNGLRPAVSVEQTDFQAGWTRQGDIGELVAELLEEATVLEGLALEIGQRGSPTLAASELQGVRGVIERYLDGDDSRNGLDDSRNRDEALAFNGDGGSPICGIVSTMREVMAFVIAGDAEAKLADAAEVELADTGAESGLLVVAGVALLGAGAMFTVSSYRRRPS